MCPLALNRPYKAGADPWSFTDNQTFIDANILLPGQEPDAFTTAKHFRFTAHRDQ